MALVNLRTELTSLAYGKDKYGYSPATDTTGVPHYNPDITYTQLLGKPNASVSQNQWLFYSINNNFSKLIGPLVTGQAGSLTQNLTTSLKSIRFDGNYRGENSGQPFVTFGIPGEGATNTQLRLYTGNAEPDQQIRGGGGAELARAYDLMRIKSFLKTTRGEIFLKNQETLQFSNPKIETGNKFTAVGNPFGITNILENTRIYNKNGETTLAQVAESGTGTHLVRQSFLSTAQLDKYYGATVNMQNVNNDVSTNRLALLYNLKMKTDRGALTNTLNFIKDLFKGTTNIFNGGNTSSITNFALAGQLGISTDRHYIFNYAGGPGSSYGIGSTTTRRVVDSTRVVTSNTMTYDQLMQQYATKDGGIQVMDFRLQTQDYSKADTTKTGSIAWDYDSSGIENRLKMGNPGKRVTNPSIKTSGGKPIDYTIPVSIDKLSALKHIITTNDPFTDNADVADIIKFGFECINNDTPEESIVLLFRAFLTAGLTDNHSGQWNPFKYMGRGENFYTYQGFDRTLSFSFRIAAQSREEMRPLYSKLNRLISQVYPDYSKAGIMRAPVVKITVGDYLYRVPSIIESINITVDNTYPWEINLEKDPNMQQLPQVLDVTVSFKPIHNSLPQREVNPTNQFGLIGNNQTGFLNLPPEPTKTVPILSPINFNTDSRGINPQEVQVPALPPITSTSTTEYPSPILDPEQQEAY